MSHTPGPWEVTFWSQGIAVDAGDREIVFIPDMGRRCIDDEANAYLIVAAPELLEALKEVVVSVDLILGTLSPLSELQKDVVRGFLLDTHKKVKAAIAKAEGRSTS